MAFSRRRYISRHNNNLLFDLCEPIDSYTILLCSRLKTHQMRTPFSVLVSTVIKPSQYSDDLCNCLASSLAFSKVSTDLIIVTSLPLVYTISNNLYHLLYALLYSFKFLLSSYAAHGGFHSSMIFRCIFFFSLLLFRYSDMTLMH